MREEPESRQTSWKIGDGISTYWRTHNCNEGIRMGDDLERISGDKLLGEAIKIVDKLAKGPTFGYGKTKIAINAVIVIL